LDNIKEGCKLLKEHLDNFNEIYLPVDPDCDGYTSAALFYNYLVDVLHYPIEKIIYHIPEGKEHGLSTIMNWFPEDGTNRLIVAIDSSSNDYEEHRSLSNRGYDILVVDHHEASKYSENATVINNQLSEKYMNKMASGVGVIYKFFECWESMYNGQSAQNYLDLVALGEISDVMQMTTSENRYICDYGLNHINNKFLRNLIKKQCYSLFGITEDKFNNNYYTNGSITQIGIAFYITPLINALIRVGNPLEKERLFQAFITPDILVPSTKRGEKGMEETICT
jgi:single-stranded-DNA-specific exonuclease